MTIIQTLFKHPNVLNEDGTKRINRTSSVMISIQVPVLIYGLYSSILTTNFLLFIQIAIWPTLSVLALFYLQKGSNSARKGILIICVLNILAGLSVFLSMDGISSLQIYVGVMFLCSVYSFIQMWGTQNLTTELSARRKLYNKDDEME